MTEQCVWPLRLKKDPGVVTDMTLNFAIPLTCCGFQQVVRFFSVSFSERKQEEQIYEDIVRILNYTVYNYIQLL